MFEQGRIPFVERYLALRLVEIGPMILEKKILECRSIFTRFHLPFGSVRFFFRTKFIPFLLLPKDALRQGEIGGSRGEDFQKPPMYIRFRYHMFLPLETHLQIKIRFTQECLCLIWLTLAWML